MTTTSPTPEQWKTYDPMQDTAETTELTDSEDDADVMAVRFEFTKSNTTQTSSFPMLHHEVI